MTLTPRLALAIFVLLGILHLWPLSSAPWRLSLNYNADAEYNAWAIAWIVRTLGSNPAGLFDANIFYPEQGTLAYSHPLVAPALVAAPVLVLGGSPVLAFNVSLFAGLVLTAWSMWLLAWKWTGSPRAALVAGALAAFHVQLLTRLPHLDAAHAWGLPLTMYLADAMMERPTRRTGLLLAAVVALTAATSLYGLALSAILLGITMLVRGWPTRATLRTAAAAGLGIAVASPLLLPYVRMARAGVRRPLAMVADFSADITGYLSSTSVLHAGWTAPFYRDDVNVLFAGVSALGLATIGIVAGRATSEARRRLAVIVAVAAAGVLLSLGPATPVYRTLYEWVTPLQGLRITARFGMLFLIAVAAGAAFGVAWLERRVRSPRWAAALAALALTAVTVEAWQGPVRVREFSGVPPIYGLLADIEGPVRLVETPFWPPEAVHFNGEYQLGSTRHWQPLMNGTSGLTPESYRRRAESFWYFPEEWAIDAMHQEGATHVMVHLERFEHEAPHVAAVLAGRPDIWLIASDSRGHRLYEFRRRDEGAVSARGEDADDAARVLASEPIARASERATDAVD